MSNDKLYSLKSEKHLLASLIKHPNLFFEIENGYTDQIFHNDVHRAIFGVIKNFIHQGKIEKNEVIDPVLIGQKLNDLGLRFNDDIEISDYVQSLSFLQVTEKSARTIAEELEKLRVCRGIVKTGEKIIQEVRLPGDRRTDQILDSIDKIYHENVKLKSFKNEPTILMDGIIEMIENIAKNPVEEVGLITHHRLFNSKFGGIRPGNIYAIVSRSGEGKSTMLGDLAIHATVLNKGCKALILDTEMETADIRMRVASAHSQIPSWYLETGNWTKRQDYVEQWNQAKDKLRREFPVHHINVAGKPISELCSLIRRWYYKNVDLSKGEKGIIVYDYIKITGEKDKQLQEYQIIGEKVNTLKELSLELNVPVLTACQLNRSGGGAQAVDDSTAISLSDRLLWFATFVAIFRRKRIEEIQEFGPEFGSHSLIPLKYRFEGRESFGHGDIVRIVQDDGKIKYMNNFLNYEVKNFNIEERGDLRQIINNREMRALQQQDEHEDDVNI